MSPRRAAGSVLSIALLAAASSAADTLSPAVDETLSFPPFGTVHVYAPAGAPAAVVLFVSGDGGWEKGVIPMARRLAAEGALVVGIDIRRLLASLESGGSCGYPAGSLEELSRAVQLRRHLPEYRAPILVGYSSGATLVYAALAQAPAETFRGAISLGFCSDLSVTRPLCVGRGLRSHPLAKGKGRDLEPFEALDVPWVVMQGGIDQVCSPSATVAFTAKVGSAQLVALPKVGHGFSVGSRWEPQYVEAYRRLASAVSSPQPASVAAKASDLDPPVVGVVEMPAAEHGELIAVLLTGDGGWAGIDKAIAGRLVASGIPVVGWNSLKYYWTPRTPEAAAGDLARILEHFMGAWGASRAIVVGYSFGADVAPFLVNRLPASLQTRVALVGLLGLSRDASFEFHVSDWLDLGRGGYPTVPEVDRLHVPVLCLRGDDERDSACGELRAPRVQVKVLPGGHHFGGAYDAIGEALVAAAGGERHTAR